MRLAVKAAVALAFSLGLGLSADGGRAQAPIAAPSDQTASPTPAASARLAPGTAIPPEQLEAFVDGVVRSSMASQHIAGVTVSVVQNGQVVLKKGYGVSSLNPATPVDPDNTLFRLGSISKTFTWITLMKEAEAGHIRLTQPINLYLPEKLQIKDQGFKRPIAVRDLMTHTAGFEDRALGQLMEKDPRSVRALADYLRQERPRRVREAGSTPVYSNYGAALAGEAVSYANGHRFQDIVDGEIIHPLSLAHTTFAEPYPARPDLPTPMAANLAANLSTGYRWTSHGFQPQAFEYMTQAAPAGALSSTAGDMARYMQMILAGGQLDGQTVYSPDTAKGFRTTTQTAAPGINGWDNGFMEFALPGGFRGQGHDGDTLWFHSNMVTVPDLGLGIFISANTDTGEGLADDLPQQIIARFYGPSHPMPRSGSPGLREQADTYAGTYLNERRPYGGLEKFVRMFIGQTQVSVTKDGRLLTAGSVTGSWVPGDSPDHFLQVDGPQTLAFDVQNGRARRLFDPSGSTVYDRIGLLYSIPALATLATIAGIVSIATLLGLFTRDRREFRQTTTQARAGLVLTTIAVLWLIAFTTFAAWGTGIGDVGQMMYHWPGPLLLIASACAFVAALLTLLSVVLAPMVWRGGRRLDSWSVWRKLRFSLGTVVYAAFSVMLLLWGALEPWSR